MIDRGKRSVLGVCVDAVDYEAACARVFEAARAERSLAVTALAVHGVMTGVADLEHRVRLNSFDLVTPDGQPVRWALNLLHHVQLEDRVYGPDLTIRLCEGAAREGLPIYLYGSKPEVLDSLEANLLERLPALEIAGKEPSKFRTTTEAEKNEISARIRESGAKIVFVGLGCPRQEVFAYEYRYDLQVPIIAVGAAFDYHAGILEEPPKWMQRNGLQWIHRLAQEPGRLWRRYLQLNTAFAALFLLQWLGVWDPKAEPRALDVPEIRYG